MKRKKPISLKRGLVFVIMLCWLLPVLLVYAGVSFYVNNNMMNHLEYTAAISANNAATTLTRFLSSAFSASKNASYDPSIKNAYSSYRSTGNETYLYNEITGFLSKQYFYDEKFSATILFFTDQPEVIYHVGNGLFATQYWSILEYKRNVHASIQQIAADLDTGIAFTGINDNIYMIRNLMTSDFDPYAVIVMQLNTAGMFSGFEGIAWQSGATVYINGLAIPVTEQPASEPLVLAPDELSYNYPAIFYRDGLMHMKGGLKSGDVKISYLLRIDRAGYIRDIFGFISIFNFLTLLLFPLMFLTIWFMHRNIFSPITRLIDTAKAIEGGNLGYQMSERPGNLEFDYLTQAVNKMSARLKQQFDQIYNEELALRDASIMALQSQINPHFLNNTLEIINWEARLNENYKVSRMIESLSTMLDAAMDRDGAPVVPLSRELTYVDAYLYIISERFGKRLTVEKRIDDSLLRHTVPRLILQPIIENAVEHGVAIHQYSTLVITVTANGDNLILRIDNDCPMTEADSESVKRLLNTDNPAAAPQLGISNVNRRLKIIYGDKAGLTIESCENHTISTILIPISQTPLQQNTTYHN